MPISSNDYPPRHRKFEQATAAPDEKRTLASEAARKAADDETKNHGGEGLHEAIGAIVEAAVTAWCETYFGAGE